MPDSLFPDLDQRIERWRRFHASEEPALLLQVYCTWGEELPSPDTEYLFSVPLEGVDWRDDADHRRYLKTLADRYLLYFTHHRVADDFIPVILPYYGQAMFSLPVADRPVTFHGATSWPEPCFSDWGDLDRLELDEDNFWFRLRLRGYSYLKQALAGNGFVESSGGYGPVDLARALRGDRIYTDFYDAPEQVHRLLDFCARAIIWMADADHSAVGEVAGGGTTHYDTWNPNCSGSVGIDASTIVSPRIFAEFEMPYLQRLLDHAPGYVLHTHTIARHLRPQYVQLRGLSMVQLTDDINLPHHVEELADLLAVYGSLPMILEVTPQEIRDNIGLLKQGRFMLETKAASEREALETLEFVRQHSPR